ncbi:MAG: cytidine deaminase [Bacteroidia bacterium]
MAKSKKINWDELSESAWNVRNNAFIFGKTKVGAAALSSTGNIYTGCNVEHMFRSHDIHAETNSISNMVSKGDKELIAIIIVAQRKQFTPCGSCMDWIFQFGGVNCLVGFQSSPKGAIKKFKAKQLMPYYPM